MMKGMIICLMMVVGLLAGQSRGQTGQCPTVTTQLPFNITEYVRAPWYIQMQEQVAYLPADEDYCVRAIYNQTSPTTLMVFNYANKGGINQDPQGGNLCAYVPDLSVPSKLAVGFCGLPHVFYGPYWVVAAGPAPDLYEWALVAGGQPTISTPNGCRSGDGVNGSGLWVFSRQQVAPASQVQMVVQIAQKQGFDTTVLNPVVQEGCLYQGLKQDKADYYPSSSSQ